MTEQANAFKLGLFVIVSTTLLIAGLIALGAGAFLRQTVMVESYFVESVQGLDVGAEVKHRGVRVGRVSRIGFVYERYPGPSDGERTLAIERGYVLVDFELDARSTLTDRLIENRAALVERGLRARLATAGLMGVVFVELVLVDPDRNPPPTISWEPEFPYIPSARSVMATIIDTAQRIADAVDQLDLSQLADRIDDFFVKIDGGLAGLDFGSLQTEALALLGELRDSNRRFRTIVDAPEIELVLGDVAQITGRVRGLVTERGDDVDAFLAELPQTAAAAQEALARVRALADDPRLRAAIDGFADATAAAAPAAGEARAMLRRINVLLASQQQDLEAIVSSLRRVLESAGEVADDATRNPSRVLFGEPPPRVNPAETGTAPRRGEGAR
ncbi:MAG TPA: MlaD family protein [Phycisphaerales bacterium]|nr:MlaD family protein [Phycisphaerales bacterium]HMP35859.1 MlaD family protein [Phycisphaerales bacterium]